MDLNKFTSKSQEVIANAQNLTITSGHQAIENAHILSSIIQSDLNVFPFISKKLGANLNMIEQVNQKILEKLPKVNGGSIHLGNQSQITVSESINIAKMQDDFVLRAFNIRDDKTNDDTSQLLKIMDLIIKTL